MRLISSLFLVWAFAFCAGCQGDESLICQDGQSCNSTPKIVTTALADASVDAAYTAPLEAAGGSPPYTWSIASGQLPAGLSLDSSGVVSGTPTSPADMDFSVALTDSKSTSVNGKMRMRVRPAAPVVTTTQQQLPNGVVGTVYNFTVAGARGTPPYSWQVTSGSLPAGLTLDMASGLVFGTPTSAGTANFTIALTDASSASASAAFSLQVFPAAAPAITTPSQLPDGLLGGAYSAALSAAGGTPPYRWQVTFGSLPPGLALSAGGVIAGTATSALNAVATITVSDANSASASTIFSLRVLPTPPVITTAPQLPNGMAGTPYSATLAATGGTTPYRWQVTAGSLPAGLTLNASSGVISGTPTNPLTATPTITVTDANSGTASVTFSLRIAPAPLVLTTAAQLPGGVVGTAYSAPLAASGGTTPYRWQVTAGTLPAGMGLDSSTGVVFGTPSSAATTTPTITVTDANSVSASATFSLNVVAAPLIITTAAALPDGTFGVAYSKTLAATGGTTPYRWQVTAGALPAGLALNSATGVISGTPTGSGTFNPTITLTDANSLSASATFSVRVLATTLSITSNSALPDGALGTAYSTTLAATGGTPPYTWQVTAGSLPAGLSLNSTTGVISGTPTGSGTFNPTFTLTDANSVTASNAFSLRITGTAITITSALQLPNGVILAPYSAPLIASGGTTPYRWQVTAGSLPAGLTLNSTTGVISGTPTTATTVTPTITVTDANSLSANATFSLRVLATTLSITSNSALPDGALNTAYSTTLAATGGTPPYTWQVTAGSLPAGLSLNSTTGVISGTPTSAVTATPTITVTDTSSATASATFSLRIPGAPLAITTAAQLPGGVIATAYSTTLTATGGTTPYRWQVTAGALPAGLALNATTGVISGTPTSGATTTPTITVTDVNSFTASATFSLSVLTTSISITSATTLPDGVMGTAYTATLAATGGLRPYRWQVTAGSLPAGLTLNSTSGVISGTPTSALTATPTITVSDANSASVGATFSLTVKAAGTGWQLVWSDEFDGTTLDSSKWLNPTNDNSCTGYTQQAVAADDSYLDGNGHLVVRAQSRASGGCGSMHLTAGQISTQGRFSQAYGRFEFRAQMPAGGSGIWPALWLYPIGVSWPPEIDVLEDVSDMSTVYMTYHYSPSNQSSLASLSDPKLATGFHTYAVEWQPGLINWYVDDVLARSSFSGSDVASTPMGILIDIYLGGWAGPVTAPLPQYLLVDYVRVYKSN